MPCAVIFLLCVEKKYIYMNLTLLLKKLHERFFCKKENWVVITLPWYFFVLINRHPLSYVIQSYLLFRRKKYGGLRKEQTNLEEKIKVDSKMSILSTKSLLTCESKIYYFLFHSPKHLMSHKMLRLIFFSWWHSWYKFDKVLPSLDKNFSESQAFKSSSEFRFSFCLKIIRSTHSYCLSHAKMLSANVTYEKRKWSFFLLSLRMRDSVAAWNSQFTTQAL